MKEITLSRIPVLWNKGKQILEAPRLKFTNIRGNGEYKKRKTIGRRTCFHH
jgi:hypothetical protein